MGVKAIGSWINNNKVAIGAVAGTCAAAYVGYNAFKGGDPHHFGDDGESGKCGGDPRRPSIDSRKWGPPAWEFLHSVTLDYPDKPTKEEQKAAKQFTESLQTMLPCNKCRGHFKDNLKVLSPEQDYYTSKQKFGQFFVDVRKSVADKYGGGTIKGIKTEDFTLDTVNELHGKGCGA